jgi:hypothetical protein
MPTRPTRSDGQDFSGRLGTAAIAKSIESGSDERSLALASRESAGGAGSTRAQRCRGSCMALALCSVVCGALCSFSSLCTSSLSCVAMRTCVPPPGPAPARGQAARRPPPAGPLACHASLAPCRPCRGAAAPAAPPPRPGPGRPGRGAGGPLPLPLRSAPPRPTAAPVYVYVRCAAAWRQWQAAAGSLRACMRCVRPGVLAEPEERWWR